MTSSNSSETCALVRARPAGLNRPPMCKIVELPACSTDCSADDEAKELPDLRALALAPSSPLKICQLSPDLLTIISSHLGKTGKSSPVPCMSAPSPCFSLALAGKALRDVVRAAKRHISLTASNIAFPVQLATPYDPCNFADFPGVDHIRYSFHQFRTPDAETSMHHNLPYRLSSLAACSDLAAGQRPRTLTIAIGGPDWVTSKHEKHHYEFTHPWPMEASLIGIERALEQGGLLRKFACIDMGEVAQVPGFDEATPAVCFDGGLQRQLTRAWAKAGNLYPGGPYGDRTALPPLQRVLDERIVYGSLTELSIWFEGAKQQPTLGSDAAFARSEDWDQFVDLLNAGMFPALRDLKIVCGTVKLVDQTNPCRATIGFDMSRLRPHALQHVESLEVVNMPLPSTPNGGWGMRDEAYMQAQLDAERILLPALPALRTLTIRMDEHLRKCMGNWWALSWHFPRGRGDLDVLKRCCPSLTSLVVDRCTGNGAMTNTLAHKFANVRFKQLQPRGPYGWQQEGRDLWIMRQDGADVHIEDLL